MYAHPRSSGMQSNEELSEESQLVSVVQPLLSSEVNHDAVVEFFTTTLQAKSDVLNSSSSSSPATHLVRNISSPQHPTQDLLETLNRQQQLSAFLKQGGDDEEDEAQHLMPNPHSPPGSRRGNQCNSDKLATRRLEKLLQHGQAPSYDGLRDMPQTLLANRKAAT